MCQFFSCHLFRVYSVSKLKFQAEWLPGSSPCRGYKLHSPPLPVIRPYHLISTPPVEDISWGVREFLNLQEVPKIEFPKGSTVYDNFLCLGFSNRFHSPFPYILYPLLSPPLLSWTVTSSMVFDRLSDYIFQFFVLSGFIKTISYLETAISSKLT